MEIIGLICEALFVDNIENDLEALVNYIEQYAVGNPFHTNYQLLVEFYRGDQWDFTFGGGRRQELNMQCTPISSFPTSTQLPPISDKFDIDFWVRFYEDVNLRINEAYGGLSPSVDNVYFTQGGIDPARLIGITEDLNESSPADVIPYLGKAWDRSSIGASDTAELRAVKKRARELIVQWTQ